MPVAIPKRNAERPDLKLHVVRRGSAVILTAVQGERSLTLSLPARERR
jgi:hypothetical protein